MGCQLGKLAASERRTNNQPDLGDGPPPATDPRLPLTAKQKYSMLASWKGISRAMEKTGICMFIKLFEENQDLLNMFEKFRQCRTKEEQINSMELAEHANNVMNTLDEGIKGLDDLDNFFEYIHQVGASHRRIPGFKVEYFWKIETPFLAAVESTLGDRLFEENEDLLHLFEDFRELRTKEAIVNSAELAEHATKVMHTLDEGIKGLADMDTFFAYVRHVGGTHRQVPGFKAENFMKIEQPFLEAAKTTLGERYTPNIENIYKMTIRFILENLVKGYEEEYE